MPGSRNASSPLDESKLASLSDAQLSRLVQGKEASSLAVNELARRSPQNLGKSLQALLREADHPDDARASAAVQMANNPKLLSEPALLEAVKSRAPSVQRRSAEALGRNGSRAALQALVALPEPGNSVARNAVRFARQLLAYRHGVDGHRFKPGAPAVDLPRAQAKPVRTRSATAEEWKHARQNLASGDLPIAASSHGQQLIECGPEKLLLVFDRRIQTPAQRRSLLSEPAVAAVLLVWDEVDEAWELDEYILSHPVDEGRAELVGVRASGRGVHRGQAQLDADGLSFSLQALPGPHAFALQLEGHITGARQPGVTLKGFSDPGRSGQANTPQSPAELKE